MEASVDYESPMKSNEWAFRPIYPLVDTNIIKQRKAAMAGMEAAPLGSAIIGPPSPPSTTKLTPLEMTSEAVWVGGQARPRTSRGNRIGQESGIDSPSTSTTGPNGPQEMKGASDSGMASFLEVSPLVSDGEVEPQPDVMTYLPSFSTPNLFMMNSFLFHFDEKVEKLDGLLKVARTEITQLNQSFQEAQKQLKEKEIADHHSDSLISSLEEELRCLSKKIEKLYSAELLAEEQATIIKKLKLRERRTLERMKLISDSEEDEIKIRAEVRREFSRKLQEKKKKLKNECALERKSMLDEINCLKLQVKDLQMKDANHYYQIDNNPVKMDFEQSCCRETEAPKNLFKSSG